MSMTSSEAIEQAIRCVVGACDETCPHYWSDNVCHGYGDVAEGLRNALKEFRELKEKATAKKPRFYAHNYHCTECGNLVGNNEFHWQRFEYCDKCGQRIDWSGGKE